MHDSPSLKPEGNACQQGIIWFCLVQSGFYAEINIKAVCHFIDQSAKSKEGVRVRFPIRVGLSSNVSDDLYALRCCIFCCQRVMKYIAQLRPVQNVAEVKMKGDWFQFLCSYEKEAVG